VGRKAGVGDEERTSKKVQGKKAGERPTCTWKRVLATHTKIRVYVYFPNSLMN
jgi:hypothetical protein